MPQHSAASPPPEPTPAVSGLQHLLAVLGRPALATLAHIGAVACFLALGAVSGWRARGQWVKVLRQVYFIGVKSIFVIALIGLFTGMVLGIQGHYTLAQYGSEGLLGGAVALSLIRELGPVLTAIMLTGRAGSSMTAEIGVMRISDQIDALEVMDIPSMGYLVQPRLLACLISFPLLTAMFDVIGILGGYLTGVELMGVSGGVYFARAESAVTMFDIMGGFYKSLVFAVIVATICCYMGYFCHRRRDGAGPEAVSNATTAGVVVSCVLILVSDYILTSFLL